MEPPTETEAETNDRPVVTLTGTLVALGPLRRDLLSTYQRWNNDFATTRTLARPGPTTFDQEAAAYDQVIHDPRYALFTIYERATWRPIGTTYLADIDGRNRTAEFGIAIGEADARGKGHGTETTRLVLDYAFTALGLHNVMLRVYAHNHAGIRAYEKAGFKEIGRRREAREMGGAIWDVVYMDCLATEFTGSVSRQVVAPDRPRP
ncbi:MAG: GNAT family protein [Thermomicrobiales bacterium]